jgi:type VI secretion system protein ImpM
MSGNPITALRPWVGFWGKLPSRGDFTRRGLPREFLAPWDAWLSAMVAEARQHLGEAWETVWDAAPPCRFLLSPGLCGPSQAAGVWLPSRDRVGRMFPLTFAMEIWGDPAHESAPFYGHAEAVGQAMLQEQLDPAAVTARLSEPCSSIEPADALPPLPAQGSLWRQGGAWLACAGMPDAEVFASLLLGWSVP